MKTQQLTNGKLATFMQALPTRLIALRKAHGLTQKETGELIGVSSFAVSQWENGAIPNSPNRQRLEGLFDEYEVKTEAPKAKTPKYVDPDGPEEFVVQRGQGLLPLRFQGKELGAGPGRGLLSDGDHITIWRTVGGNLVWETTEAVGHGVDADFFHWVETYTKESKIRAEILDWAASWGVTLYEDIA